MMEAINYLRIQAAAARARSERGASAVEYGLLVALIAIGIILAVVALKDGLNHIFNKTAGSLNAA